MSKHYIQKISKCVIMKYNIKTVIRWHFTSIKNIKTKQNIDTIKNCQRCGAVGTLIRCWTEDILIEYIWKMAAFTNAEHQIPYDLVIPFYIHAYIDPITGTYVQQVTCIRMITAVLFKIPQFRNNLMFINNRWINKL